MMSLAGLAGLALLQTNAAVPDERGGDVWCNEFEAGEGFQEDCSLLIPDTGFLHFDFIEDDYEYRLEMTQHTFGQHGWMVFPPIFVDGAYDVPQFIDLDRDGANELLVPLMSGNVNTNYSVWQTNAAGVFQPVGSINAVSIDYTGDHGGLIMTGARGSAVTWYQTAHRFEDGVLKTVYEMVTDYGRRECRFEQAPDASSGIDADALLTECNREFE